MTATVMQMNQADGGLPRSAAEEDSPESPAKTLAFTADRVGKVAVERAGAAKDWAGERAGVARDWALDQTDVIRDTVQTKPFVAVGVSAASAFAAGLIVGMLLTRN